MTQKFVTLFTLLFTVSISSSDIVDVVVAPSEKELPAGESVTLTCIVDDVYKTAPDSSISWEYPTDVNMESVTIEYTHFTITSMSESNIGTYTCKYIGIKDGVFCRGTGTSAITIKPEQPGQPQNVAVTAFTGDSITLQWEAGFWGYSDMLYYKLEILEEGSAWTPWHEDVAADVLEYTATGLRSEQSYMFRISQVSKGGQSIPSDPTSWIYLRKPGAMTVYPTVLRLEEYNSTAVRVIWTTQDEYSGLVEEWYVEYRLKEDSGEVYRAQQVDRKVRLRERLSDEITPVSAKHSHAFDDNEEEYAAAHAIDLDRETMSKTVADSDGDTWLRLSLDQVRCIGQVVEYNKDGSPQYTWTCSDTDCATCEGGYCADYSLTVSIKGATPNNLPRRSDCRYGDSVKLERTDESYFSVREIAIQQALSATISMLGGLEEASTYQIRMYSRNEKGRGPPSPVFEITTLEAAPSAPAQNVRVVFVDIDTRELDIRWSEPPPRDTNGELTGYRIKLYYTDPAEQEGDRIMKDVERDPPQLTLYPSSLPCWVAVAAKTGQGVGPFSDFVKVSKGGHTQSIPSDPTNYLPKPVQGSWSQYNDWTECTAACGGGERSRDRTCISSTPGVEGDPYCEGERTLEERCNLDPCLVSKTVWIVVGIVGALVLLLGVVIVVVIWNRRIKRSELRCRYEATPTVNITLDSERRAVPDNHYGPPPGQ